MCRGTEPLSGAAAPAPGGGWVGLACSSNFCFVCTTVFSQALARAALKPSRARWLDMAALLTRATAAHRPFLAVIFFHGAHIPYVATPANRAKYQALGFDDTEADCA